MKKTIGLFAGAAGALLMASQANAVFTPPEGDITFKLTDAGNLYHGFVADPRSDAFATYPFDAADTAALQAAVVGARDFTAFTLTSYGINGGTPDIAIPGTVTGIVTFLKVGSLETSNFAGGQIALDLVDDSSATRGESGAPAGYVGRFFLFDTTGQANAGTFNTAGGLPGDVQWFDGTGAGATVSSNGVDFFDIDLLSNFTVGTAGTATTTDRLLLTGTIQLDPNDSTLIDLLTNSNLSGISFSGLIADHGLLFDGGTWFDQGIIDSTGSFKINQTGYSNYDPTYPGFGNQGVYEGGWQIASEDPVQVTIHGGNEIPEPVTAGLGFLALSGLASYVTARRKA